MPGVLVISLDFELYWGVRDRCALTPIIPDLLATRRVIADILERFEAHRIRATWATVGLLFFRSQAALLTALPRVRPQYEREAYSSYADLRDIGPDEASDPFRYGLSLIEEIGRHSGQEIGTHTFSHYFALEDGQTGEAFRCDLDAAADAAREVGHTVRSLVFPRNQCNEAYLPICRQAGIMSYRGNPDAWLYKGRRRRDEGRLLRALRLMDAYVNLSGHHTYPLPETAPAAEPLNVPASRFLRPWSRRLRSLEWLRLYRLKRSMTRAARRGEVFHLWWHPENFGRNCQENLRVLDQLLQHFEKLRQRYAMSSFAMGDIAAMAHESSKFVAMAD